MEYFGFGLDQMKMEESGVAEEVIVISQPVSVSGDCLICSTGLTSDLTPSKFNTDLLLELCKILKISSTILDRVEINQDSWLPCPLYCASCEDTIRKCVQVFEEIKERERILDSLVNKIKTYFIASYRLPYTNYYNGNYPHSTATASDLAARENSNNFVSNEFQFSSVKNTCCDAKFQIRKTFAQCWSNCTVNVNRCDATKNTGIDDALETQEHSLKNEVKNDPDNETDDFTHSQKLSVSGSSNCTVDSNKSGTPINTGTNYPLRTRTSRRPSHTPVTIQFNKKSDSEIDSDIEFQEDIPYIPENVSERGEDQDSSDYDSDNLNKNDVKNDPDDTEMDASRATQRSPGLLVKKCVAKTLRIDKRKQIPGRIYNFTCKKCGKAYDQQMHYLNHLKCHSGKLDVPCNLCHVKFVSMASLKIHKRQAHKDEDENLQVSEKSAQPKIKRQIIKSTYNCHLCGRGYEKAIHYQNHIKVHQGKLEVRCQICPDKFVSQLSLKLHVQRIHREHHPQDPTVAHAQFQCDIDNCSKTYGSKKLLLVHQKIKHADKTIHQGDKRGCDLHFDPSGSGKLLSFTCYFCKKEFTRANCVNSEDTAYQCDIFECGKTYPLTHFLKFANHHEFTCPERPKDVFECEFCSKSFFSKANLTNHRITVHTKTYPYYCDKCGKGQASLATLNTHNRNVHLGYVFKCEVCKLSFKNKGRFTSHMRRHDGDLRYVCVACGKAFLLSDQLKRHEAALHTVGDNTFSCDMCDKSFKTKHYLRNHVWNVHQKSGRKIKIKTQERSASTRKKSKKGKKQRVVETVVVGVDDIALIGFIGGNEQDVA